jgi:DNA primase
LSERERLQPLSDSQREALEEATASYQAALTRDAARYLHGRKITVDVASTFRLGVVLDPFPGHGKFYGFLSIPYIGHDGRILTLRFRCLQDHNCREYGHGKYMSMADDPARMFNVRAVTQADTEIHVTEGEFDAITLNAIGLPAVAIPGAQGWQRRHKHVLEGFQRIYVWGDPDDAGAKFTNSITRALPRAKGIRMPGDDVNGIYKQGGAEAIRALIHPKEPTA